MKRLFNKGTILNVLALVAIIIGNGGGSGQMGGCALFFYEPEKPKLLDKIAKEELLNRK